MEKLYHHNHVKEVMFTLKSQIFYITQIPNLSSSVYEQYSVDYHKF